MPREVVFATVEREVSVIVEVTREVPVDVAVPETVVVEREVIVTREVGVTVEVEKVVTRTVPQTVQVEVTREVRVPIEVAATREVYITREVEVTRELEVTRQVETVREVPVTRVVEVTRVVQVPAVVPTPGLMPSLGFLSMTPRLVYGPRDGSIEMRPSNAGIDGFEPNVNLQDFIVEAEFQNPYPTAQGSWSVGFLIRQQGYDHQHAIIIDSDGDLNHFLRAGLRGDGQHLYTFNTVLIDTSFPGENLLTVIADGEVADVFINGEYASLLDLSGLVEKGSVIIVGLYYRGHGIVGRSTSYDDFSIWSAYQR